MAGYYSPFLQHVLSYWNQRYKNHQVVCVAKHNRNFSDTELFLILNEIPTKKAEKFHNRKVTLCHQEFRSVFCESPSTPNLYLLYYV